MSSPDEDVSYNDFGIEVQAPATVPTFSERRRSARRRGRRRVSSRRRPEAAQAPRLLSGETGFD